MPPVIAGIAAVGSAVAGGFAATAAFIGVSQFALAATIVSTAASFGLNYYQQQQQKAAAKKAQARQAVSAGAVAPEAARQSLRASVAGRRTSYGEVKVAGQIVFYEARSNFLTIVWAINQGFIDGVSAVFLNGKEVILDSAGFVMSAPWVLSGSKLISMEVSLGQTEKTEVSGIVAGAYPEFWTSAHRGDGIAYVAMKMQGVGVEDWQKVYKGRVPEVAFVVRSRRVYDPRDAEQDSADSTTWVYSDNAALCLADFLQRRDGMNLGWSRIDMAALATAADVCDEPVALAAGGTEPRWRVAGTYDLTSDPIEAIRGMTDAMAGRVDLNPANGKLRIHAGRWTAPTVALGEANIIRATLGSKPDGVLSFNTVKATYTSPEHDYSEQDAQPYQDEANVLRTGLARVEPLPLPWCPSFAQARRLSKIALGARNPRWSGTIVADISSLAALGEEMIELTVPGAGCYAQPFRVNAAAVDLDAATVTFDVSHLPEYPFDWTASAEEGDAPPVPPNTEDSSLIIPAPVNLRTQVDASNIARMRWTVTRAPADAAATYSAEMRYRQQGAGSWTTGATVGASYGNSVAGVTAGVTYEWQVRAVNAAAGRFSDWSATATFLGDVTVATPSGPPAVSGTDGTGEATLNATVTSQTLEATYTSGVEFKLEQGGSVVWSQTFDYMAGLTQAYLKNGLAAGDYDLFARARNMAFLSSGWVSGGSIHVYAPAETGAPPPATPPTAAGSDSSTAAPPATGGSSPGGTPESPGGPSDTSGATGGIY